MLNWLGTKPEGRGRRHLEDCRAGRLTAEASDANQHRKEALERSRGLLSRLHEGRGPQTSASRGCVTLHRSPEVRKTPPQGPRQRNGATTSAALLIKMT